MNRINPDKLCIGAGEIVVLKNGHYPRVEMRGGTLIGTKSATVGELTVYGDATIYNTTFTGPVMVDP